MSRGRSRDVAKRNRREVLRVRHPFLVAAGLVLLIKVLTSGLGMMLAQDTTRFDIENYLQNFHHFEPDSRLQPGGTASFLDLWNYSDGEWYLSIARNGYPDLKVDGEAPDLSSFEYLRTAPQEFRKFAFFPLYPWLIRLTASVLPVKLAAFVVNLLAGLAAGAVFVSLWRLTFPGRIEDGLVALALTFLYPFSVFYCLYFSESLFLLLSLLLFLALQRGAPLAAGVAGALLTLSRPTGVLAVGPMLWAGIFGRGPASQREAGTNIRWFGAAGLIVSGLVPVVVLNQRLTGHWNAFALVQKAWKNPGSIWENLWHNLLRRGLTFDDLEFHLFHSSQVDYVVALLCGICLAVMWLDKRFPRELTVWATLLWAVPLLTKDLMSFSRYVSVAFPFFMYFALRWPRFSRYGLVPLFAVGYYYALDGVIRYLWVG